ncbi:hypothetical protein POM88_005509 [Heracleum sosnowskyi]|uniref:MORF/ORRM1/DAG-like MORF domain-containing protein n=1 Tax=Heracleum sosnowskyi TaxID=360622 RepID=A0AAD8J1L6_9APIA|nr:hypothetical protein POM88_005509 [Heracleum sosnowskyi]
MAAKRIISLFRSCSSSSDRAFASSSGVSRTTVALSPDPVEDIAWRRRLEDFGTDYKHWFVSVEEPVGSTREEMAAHYVKILSAITGSEDEAQEAEELKKVPHVDDVLPDSNYADQETKDYGGEPFIDGQLVPYDPKYHMAVARLQEEAEARARGEIETDEEDDDDDDDNSNYSCKSFLLI